MPSGSCTGKGSFNELGRWRNWKRRGLLILCSGIEARAAHQAGVAEPVDASGLGPGGETHGGSSPLARTYRVILVYETIVTGTDGSETANQAVTHAIQLAKLAGAKLHIVSAYKSVPAIAMAAPDAMSQLGATSADWESQVVAEVNSMLKGLEQQATKAGVETKTHAIEGDPTEIIVELADKAKADLIVVGNRGMTGAGRFLLGSVPNKISHHSPCSVLIVHTD